MVHERSARLYDTIYAFKDYAAESAQLHALIQQRKQIPGNTLLDVACGTGAHLAHLRQHYAVQGLDVDPEQLRVARERCPGVTFHQGDMVNFDLGQSFDVVLCLFGSIGYVKTAARLQQTIQRMAHHVRPGGLVIVEPWLTPETYHAGRPYAVFIDQPQLKIARMNVTTIEGDLSILNFHYLVATPDGVEHFAERHELCLFSHDDYLTAFRLSHLEVTHDPEGLIQRGLYIGLRPLV
jgi:SAM-dependent methyltransferase